MKTITVLGGGGAVGRVAVQTLVRHGFFDHVRIADMNTKGARELAGSLGPAVSVVDVHAEDTASVKQAIAGSDVVLNCVGPFYRSVKAVLSAVLEAGIDYVDVCDDVDVTEEILAWNDKAASAGIRAVIGMGSSPGATNLIARYAADELFDEVEAIDIFHAHGGEPFEGPGVIGHRFHCMTIDIPMYLDGELKTVKYFEPDGVALRRTFDFPVLGRDVLLYPYPHPEQVTLPRHITTRRVTNLGTVLPAPYYDLTRDLCQLGLADKTPLEVNGKSVTPYDFAVAYIIRERERILAETGFGRQRGCVSVVVSGTKDGQAAEYRFHMASASQALGEGTGIPAAGGAILMGQGQITRPGVLPPEAAIRPQDFLDLIPHIMGLDSKKQGGEGFGGVIVEHIDARGNKTTLDLGF